MGGGVAACLHELGGAGGLPDGEMDLSQVRGWHEGARGRGWWGAWSGGAEPKPKFLRAV